MATTVQHVPDPVRDVAVKRRKSTPTLSAAHYCAERVFEVERRRIFHSAWQYVGHASMAEEPGDYFTADVVGAAVVLVRGRDGVLRAYYNACQHRGHALKQGSGRCARLVCPYHAWSYDLDGSLERAPHAEDLDGFDRARAALRRIRLETFHGLLFVNTDPSARPLAEQAPDLGAEMAKHAPRLAELVHVRRAEFELAANWKIAIDNFLECYHCQLVHKSLVGSRDLDGYRVAVSSIWSSQHSDERPSGELRSPWNMSRASNRHTVSWWLWPTLCLVKHPGDDRLIALSHRIEATERTVQVVDFYLASREPSAAEEDYMRFHLENVRVEDKAVIEGVQRGMRSGGFTSGQLVDGTEDDGPWTEHAVAHFQRLVHAAVEGEI